MALTTNDESEREREGRELICQSQPIIDTFLDALRER